ncbi:MAG: glycosyltransferase family 4 protein [Deltaproteobacteria bacterium]
MVKIAVVIPKYGLVGGAEQFASELTGRLAEHTGYNFHVFANRWQGDYAGINFHHVPILALPKFLTTLSFAYFTGRQLSADSFSLVHSHERIFAADIWTLHGVPHRYWIHCVRKKMMSLYDLATAWVEKKMVTEGNCQKFIAVSNLTRDIFLQEYNIDPQRVTVIHPGVDLKEYATADKKLIRTEIRKEYSFSSEEPIILFASMNFEIKGLDAIMLALAKLKAQQHSFKLLVVGKGNVKKYTQIAHENNITENVVFTGILSKKKLIRLYLAGDVYVMLSKFDTFGMVVLEAMAAGLPVIISSNVGAKDIVQEGENGFIITDTSDTDYIASKLKMTLDESLSKMMSAAAYQTATENTWEMVAIKYRKIYTDIIDGKNMKGQ